jgi:ribose transport system substrate-binding protein
VFSPQTYADYEKLFVKQFPYSDDEIKNMTNASFDQLKEMAEKLSIEDAKKRLGR